MIATGFLMKWDVSFKNTINLTANVYNFNLYDELKKRGWNEKGKVDVTVVIASGVVIGSTSTDSPSFEVGEFENTSSINIINNGTIVGAGGVAGKNGGPALYLYSDTSITNNGAIYGGGGGGASFREIKTINNHSHLNVSGDGGSGAGSYKDNIFLKTPKNGNLFQVIPSDINRYDYIQPYWGGFGGALGSAGGKPYTYNSANPIDWDYVEFINLGNNMFYYQNAGWAWRADGLIPENLREYYNEDVEHPAGSAGYAVRGTYYANWIVNGTRVGLEGGF